MALYQDPVWQFSVQYPADTFPLIAPMEAQGDTIFESSDKKARLIFFAGPVALQLNAKLLAIELAKIEAHTVTYRRVAKTWIVLRAM